MSTTIQVEEETREKLKSWGKKGETYDDIVNKLYDIAVKEQLRELLLSSEDTLSIDEALEETRTKWPA